jgi:hypothetical protein
MNVIYLIGIGIGFLIGLAIGRWWALVIAAGFGIWVGGEANVDEVPHWFLGLAYGAITALGIAAGIVARRASRST